MNPAGTIRRRNVEAGAVHQLAPFVPRLALDLADGGSPSWTSLEGSMLSADISGFTALSERLARKGKAGAEEITSLINACFTALIDAAYRFDGEVVKFGGDALLIVFRGAHHERRAADAGLAMQRALVASSAAKRARLSMTVGVAAGPFDVFVVGSGYRELLISGRRASEVIRLEAAAEQGETLVSPSIAAALPASMLLAERDGGVVVAGATGDPDSTIAPRCRAARQHLPVGARRRRRSTRRLRDSGRRAQVGDRRLRDDHRSRVRDRSHRPRGNLDRSVGRHRPRDRDV